MALLLGALLWSAVLAGCGTAGPQLARGSRADHHSSSALAGPNPDRSLSRFAGYVLIGRVTSVEASWGVPQVLPGSDPGEAGTWIGAEAHSWQEDAPFIQVGTNEGRFASANASRTDDVYWAFWTDTRHHYLPITLFPVHAGDQIKAALTLRNGRWIIAINDTTSHTRVTFSTREEGLGRPDWAEWEQEDIGNRRQAGPYPHLSTLTFRDVRANGAAPDRRHLISLWMNSNQGMLAPGNLRRSSFTLRPPTGTAQGSFR